MKKIIFLILISFLISCNVSDNNCTSFIYFKFKNKSDSCVNVYYVIDNGYQKVDTSYQQVYEKYNETLCQNDSLIVGYFCTTDELVMNNEIYVSGYLRNGLIIYNKDSVIIKKDVYNMKNWSPKFEKKTSRKGRNKCFYTFTIENSDF